MDGAVAVARAYQTAARSAERHAQTALTQAQSVSTEASQQGDAQALSIAEQAVQVAQAALDRARSRLAQAQAVVSDIERYARAPGTIDGAAVRLQGHVTITHAGKSLSSSASGRAGALNDGDQVSTGNGTAEFFFKDGSSAVLAPNTVYRVEHITATRAAYYLVKGELHEVSERVKVHFATAVAGVLGQNDLRTVHTPCCVVAVRGTSFDMRTDSANALHVHLYEGRIDVRSSAIRTARDTGCKTRSAGRVIHVMCGTSAQALNYHLRAGSVRFMTLTRGCEFTVTADGSDAVIEHGSVSLDAGERAPPSHGWWNDGR